jgi:hypothetical protein
MEEGPVDPQQLGELIGRADRIVVTSRPFANSRVLFESANWSDIAEFGAAVGAIPPAEGWYCMCTGTPAVWLYREGEPLATVTNHYGASIRCTLWSSDAELQDPEKWMQWFDAREMPSVRQEVDRLEENLRKRDADHERWKSRMPATVSALWEQEIRKPEPLHEALTQVVPDVGERVRMLFAWFDSGEGSWFNHPYYECVASEILFHFSTAELIAALETGSLTAAELEGAARFFCGWNFGQLRPDDRQLLPASLKRRLLEHVRESRDLKKIQLAESILGNEVSKHDVSGL